VVIPGGVAWGSGIGCFGTCGILRIRGGIWIAGLLVEGVFVWVFFLVGKVGVLLSVDFLGLGFGLRGWGSGKCDAGDAALCQYSYERSITTSLWLLNTSFGFLDLFFPDVTFHRSARLSLILIAQCLPMSDLYKRESSSNHAHHTNANATNNNNQECPQLRTLFSAQTQPNQITMPPNRIPTYPYTSF